jgi:hypothetical protein
VSRTLDAYLKEVSHYLAVPAGAHDILAELKSHILEKTESEYGSITDDAVGRVIEQLGPPHVVASRYLEGTEIIAPIFQRHLILYTGLLFAAHLLLFLICSEFHLTIVGLPFLYIPALNDWRTLFYLPMALIYDLGLVLLLLLFVTRHRPGARLPWPRFLAVGAATHEETEPRIVPALARVVLLATFVLLFVRFGTCFFLSLDNPRSPVPMFGPYGSRYVSVVFLAILATEAVRYAARYVNRSPGLSVAADVATLLLLQFLWNSPVPIEYPVVQGVSIRPVVIAALFCITAAVLFRLLRLSIGIGEQRLASHRRDRLS